MSPRLFSVLFMLILAMGNFVPARAHAQVCNPLCNADEVCVAEANGTTVCQVSELVVTASKPAGTAHSFKDIVNGPVTQVGNLIIELLYGIAFFFFLFGVFKFFLAGGEKGREAGKQYVLYGIIGLAVLFAVWSLTTLFISTLSSWSGV